MDRFFKSQDGNVAVIFAIAILPVLAATGAALDYARAVNAKTYIQNETDSAALRSGMLGPDGDPTQVLKHLREAATARYGPSDWIANLQVEGGWIAETDFQVRVTGIVPVTILKAVPGFPNEVPIGATAVARINEPRWVYKEPEVAQLEPEAADYNRIYVYCFDPEKKGDVETQGRLQMTAIADNAGTEYNYQMPQCEAGQFLSYRLMNVRDARKKKGHWDNPNVERYDYYSDTEIRNGLENYDLGGWDILETVLCNNLEECVPVSQGGVIPEGRDRIPQRANQPCAPGKYMYYGWEDRPPGRGWTDRDYDDIRIIIECPVREQVGERTVRLIR